MQWKPAIVYHGNLKSFQRIVVLTFETVSIVLKLGYQSYWHLHQQKQHMEAPSVILMLREAHVCTILCGGGYGEPGRKQWGLVLCLGWFYFKDYIFKPAVKAIPNLLLRRSMFQCFPRSTRLWTEPGLWFCSHCSVSTWCRFIRDDLVSLGQS